MKIVLLEESHPDHERNVPRKLYLALIYRVVYQECRLFSALKSQLVLSKDEYV